MKRVTVEIFKSDEALTLRLLSEKGFRLSGQTGTADSVDPRSQLRTVFVRGSFDGPEHELQEVAGVVRIHEGYGITELLKRAK